MIARFLIPLMMGLWAAGSPTGEVAEVRIAPTGSQTEISIMTSGEVEVRDFLLDDPARLIVDLEGARHALPGHAFEGIARGGVVRLRTSQFRDDVVRLVFELSRALDYSVERSEGTVRVLFSNPGGSFESWSTSPAARRLDPAVAAQLQRSSGRARADAANARGAPAQQSAQPEISVRYDSAGMLEVISGFAEFAGVSIVPGEGVAGKTVRGVDIQDQPWDVALDAILSSQGLGWRRTESGIILVDELANLRTRDTLQTETRVFRINYAGADSVAQTLRQLASGKGQVVAYQGTNSVIVTDVPSVVTRMDSLINVLDRRTPQVAIEAKLVFVDRTKVNELGIGYSLRDSESATAITNALSEADQQQQGGNIATVTPGGEAVSALANADGRLPAAALSILAHTAFAGFDLFGFIDALGEQQLTDVQAAPTIQVVDNQPARIQVGEDVPIRVLEQGAQVQQAQVTVQFEQTGVILEVTPHVTNNNQVLLEVRAERSGVNLGQSDVGFTIDRQIGETQVLVDNGETAVIGGLTRSEVSRSVSGIPGLMDIPVLGALFRTQREQEFKEDLIILVTPHVSSPTADVTTVSSAG